MFYEEKLMNYFVSSTKGNVIIFLIYLPVKVDNLFMFSNIVYVNV
jgi:hypothetical protein